MRFFEYGGFSSNFYDVQASAFLDGQLSVSADVASIEGFVVNGKTYLYYGPLLALARIPIAVFGSWADGRLVRLSMTVGFVAVCFLTFRLYVQLRFMLKTVQVGSTQWRPALAVAAVAVSPVLALGGQTSVYYETELWAFVFMLFTISCALKLVQTPTLTNVVIASFAATLTLHTRASVGFGALALVVLVSAFYWRRERILFVTACATTFFAFISHVALNYAKFGTFLNLPADKQVLTLLDPNRASWFAENNNSFFGLHFVPTTLFHYVRPDAIAFERLVPFIRFGPTAREFSSSLESYTPSSSLTVSAMFLVVLAFVGVVHVVRRRHIFIAPFVLGGLVALFPTLAIGFVANRYLVDLLPTLVVLALIGILSWKSQRRLAARFIAALLILAGGWVNASFAAWLGNIERPGFTAWRYGLDKSLFGGEPPSVVRVGINVPRDGVVGVDGNCDGLYISVQNRWHALELADGVRHIQGTLNVGSGKVVLTGPQGESLYIEKARPNEVVVVYRDSDGREQRGSAVTTTDDVLNIRVTSDPTSGWVVRGLRVNINGINSLTSLDALKLTDFAPGQNFEVNVRAQNGTPVCRDLVAKR